MKLIRLNSSGRLAAYTALLGLLVLFVVLVDPDHLRDFLKGPITGWLQAIGSIAAIFATYQMGERTFRKQLHKEKIEELERKLMAYRVVQVVLEHSDTVNQLSSEILKNRAITEIRIQATEALQMLNSIPVLEVPDANLVRSISLARQAMSMYLHWCSIWAAPFSGGDFQRWFTFAKIALEDSSKAVFSCEHNIARLDKKIQRLQMNSEE